MSFKSPIITKGLFALLALACTTPWVTPPLAMVTGFLVSQTTGHPLLRYNQKAIRYLLQASIVGLGFGINLFDALTVGVSGFNLTLASISCTLVAAFYLGKKLMLNRNMAMLIGVGTAICGGSAIAAVSPLIQAREEEISVSLGTVFILNAIALFLFPLIGTFVHLDEAQFGTWCAVAIHDTSSVVGAAQSFGTKALQVATTLKLERTLWIIPVSLAASIFYKSSKGNIRWPYFIFLFVAAMAVNTFLEIPEGWQDTLVYIARRGLTLTLFLIGAGLSREALKKVGLKPLLLGIILWVLIASGSLAYIALE